MAGADSDELLTFEQVGGAVSPPASSGVENRLCDYASKSTAARPSALSTLMLSTLINKAAVLPSGPLVGMRTDIRLAHIE